MPADRFRRPVVSEAAEGEAPGNRLSVATLPPTTTAAQERLLAQIEKQLGIVRCRACRRPLTRLRSILAGIGPICRLKHARQGGAE